MASRGWITRVNTFTCWCYDINYYLRKCSFIMRGVPDSQGIVFSLSLGRGPAWGSIYTLYLIFWAIYTLYLIFWAIYTLYLIFFWKFIPYTLFLFIPYMLWYLYHTTYILIKDNILLFETLGILPSSKGPFIGKVRERIP